MKLKRSIILVVLIILLSFIGLAFNKKNYVSAEAQCPANMTLQECYNYYLGEKSKLENKEKQIQKKIKDEAYQQLSLNEKISYIQGQISQNESYIKSLQIDIVAQEIAISILQKEIEKREDNISLLKQEINILSTSINERVSESYKNSFTRQFEILLDVRSFSTLLRRIKYLSTTRKEDSKALEEHASTIVELGKEEDKLTEDKKEVQNKKETIEEEKEKLIEIEKELNAQKSEQANLLAQSKRREALYLAEQKQINIALNAATEAQANIYDRMVSAGYFTSGKRVAKGEPIGTQGHTGCSFGSHLHYQLRDRYGTAMKPSSNGYLSNIEYGGTVIAGIYSSPVSKAYVTQDYNRDHLAIDVQSRGAGNQAWDSYTVPYGLCPQVDGILNKRKNMGIPNWNQAYLIGEGAPVYASTSGKVTYCRDGYGSTWALLIHDDGNRTYYVHLQHLPKTSYDKSCTK